MRVIRESPQLSKAIRVLLYAFGTLLAFYLVAVGIMSTSWFRSLLERQVVSRLEELTGGRVEIQAMRFNPAILQITLGKLIVHGTEPPEQTPLFAADRVVARLNVVPFAGRKFRLRSLEWEKARLRLVTWPDGSTNFPGARAAWPPGQGTDKFFDLSIGNLNLPHTQIDWNDRSLPFEVGAREAAILLRRHWGGRYAGSLSAATTRIEAPGWSLPPVKFTSQFEIGRGGVKISSLVWQSAGLRGQASGTLLSLPHPEVSFVFQADGDIPELARSLQVPGLRRGYLRLEGQGKYQKGELTAQGRVEAQELTFRSDSFSPEPANLSADFVASRRRIEFSNLTISTLAGTTRGQAEVTFTGLTPTFVVRSQIRALDLATLLRSFPRTRPILSPVRPAAKIEGTALLSWSGRLENLKSEFNLDFRPISGPVQNFRPITGHVRARVLLPGALIIDIDQANLQTSHSILSAQGTLSSSQSALSIKLATTSYEDWRPVVGFLSGASGPLPFSLNSRLIISAAVSGPFMQPEIRGRIQSGEFNYRGWTWDGLSTNFVATPRSIEASSGRLERQGSSVNLEASANLENWALTPRSFFHFSASADRAPLEGLKAAFNAPYPFSGLVTGHLDARGTTSSLSGSGFLRIDQGAYYQEPIDSISAKITINEANWNLENIILTKGGGRVTGRLELNPSRHTFSSELHGTDFSLSEFKHLQMLPARSAKVPQLDGRANFDLKGGGSPEDVRLHSNWTVRDIHLGGDSLGEVRANLDWEGQEIRLDGLSKGPSGTLDFKGEIHSDASWPLTFSGHYEMLRVEPWIRLLQTGKFNARVRASGSFQLTGTLKEPGPIQLLCQTQNLEVSLPGLTWKNEKPVNFRYAAGELVAERFRMRGPSTDLQVEGRIRFGDAPNLSLNIEGQAEASLLELIDPAVHASGRSNLTVLVRGSPAEPLLNGTLNVQDVSLSYGDLPFRVTGLSGEIGLEGERATIRSLRGASGGGTVTLSGFVSFGDAPRFELRTGLDKVRVQYPTDFTSVLNGDLRLAGAPERGQIAGDLTVRQLFVSENFNILSRITSGANPLGERFPGVVSPVASKIRLNVQVTSAPTVRLETRDWHLLADIDVHLQGTLANPVQVGTIHFQSGEAVFRNNRYRLDRGEIRMSNPLRTEPILDLEATTRVQRYDLTVDLSGPFDRLKFAYRSDPPLPSADILSLLALGYSREQEEMSTAGNQYLPTVGASALLSQALSSQVTGRVQRLFGVSRIKVDPNVGGPGNSTGARVTIEQQLTRDFTLTYVTNTTNSQYRVIQFEWALSENTSLLGVRDQNGIFGIEIKFRHRFR